MAAASSMMKALREIFTLTDKRALHGWLSGQVQARGKRMWENLKVLSYLETEPKKRVPQRQRNKSNPP
jgi:hypothetical protein